MKTVKVILFILILLVAVTGLIFILTDSNFLNEPELVDEVSETETEPVPDPITEREPIPDSEVIVSNLDVPWEIRWLPDGDMLISQRPGQLIRVNEEGEGTILREEQVVDRGEGGMLGLALHPKFEDNGWIYSYQTLESNGRFENRVYRYRLRGDELIEKTLIIGGIPGGRFHNGGRLEFGPDNLLYITTGDAEEVALSQNRDSLAGKILRLSPDGSVPTDNPFTTPIYSYGHRNPQGLTWDQSGRLWSSEHGPVGFDEINLITAGGNYGWPIMRADEATGLMPRPDSIDLIPPKLTSGSQTANTWAPSGTEFLPDDKLLFVGLRGSALFSASVTGSDLRDLQQHFTNEFGRLRAVRVGPDGLIYIATNNRDGRGQPIEMDDRVIRINPDAIK